MNLNKKFFTAAAAAVLAFGLLALPQAEAGRRQKKVQKTVITATQPTAPAQQAAPAPQAAAQPAGAAKQQAAPVPAPQPRTITISLAGDCTLGEFKGQDEGLLVRDYYDMKGPDWFFANVKPVFAQDDFTFVNLEGPLTNLPQVAVKQFPIKGDVRNVNALTAGSVEVCNLCNNHIQDCGDAGMVETEEVLAANGIAYCGGTLNGVLLEKKGIKTAFLGYDGWATGAFIEDMIAEDIAAMRAQGAKLVVCEFHWGEERAYRHNPIQQALAHHAIDCGADIVVGAHSHVLQDTEIYQGKLICYSLGNFSFGANSDPVDKDTVIVQQTFVETPTGMAYGETKFLPCRISSVDYENNYQPTPFSAPEDIARVLEKLQVD